MKKRHESIKNSISGEDLFLIRPRKYSNQSTSVLAQILFNTPKPDVQNFKRIKSIDISTPKDDLYMCMRAFLCLGRIFGIVPISGLFKNNLNSLQVRSRSFARILSLSVIILLFIYNGISLVGFFRQKKSDASEITTNLREFIFGGIGLYVYIFMYRNSSKLIQCFHKWRAVQTTFYKEDVHLFRSISLISGIIFSLGFVENFGSHWKVARDTFFSKNVTKQSTGQSSLAENYFLEEYPQFVGLIPFHLSIAIFFYIGDKCAVYAWNFGDIFIAVLGRAFYKRFKLHFEDFKEKLDEIPSLLYDPEVWHEAVEDHKSLLQLLNEFTTLLSPLVFASIFTNIYFIGVNLFFFLVPTEENAASSTYNAFAFLQLLLRTFTAIYYCAKVNDSVHLIGMLLENCPITTYTNEIKKTFLKLKISTIGFDGLNCFTITKPFILSVFNVIFTLEIVLLQTSMGSKSSGNS